MNLSGPRHRVSCQNHYEKLNTLINLTAGKGQRKCNFPMEVAENFCDNKNLTLAKKVQHGQDGTKVVLNTHCWMSERTR